VWHVLGGWVTEEGEKGDVGGGWGWEGGKLLKLE